MGKVQSKLSPELVEKLATTTHFEPKEITSWYKGFIKDCPKASLEKKEFLKMYKQYFPFGDPSKFAHYVFNLLDKDKNGELDFVEFIQALSISRGSLAEKLEWAFGLYDLDEDNQISRAEMFCIVDAMYRMIYVMDLPEDENTAEKKVNKLFELMDKDRDGYISKSEFKESAQQDPLILNSLSGLATLV